MPGTDPPDFGHITLDRFQIRIAEGPRFGQQAGVNLQSPKLGVLLKRKRQFIMVHDMKHDDFVPSQPKLL